MVRVLSGASVERKSDILIQLVDTDVRLFGEELLDDLAALGEVFSDIDSDLILQAIFLTKVPSDIVAKLIAGQFLSDDAFSAVLLQTTFPRIRVVDIMRELSFDDRNRLLAQLKEKDEGFADVEQAIDEVVQIQSGVVMTDVSKKLKRGVDQGQVIRDLLADMDTSMETFKNQVHLWLQQDPTIIHNEIRKLADDPEIVGNLWEKGAFSSQAEFAIALKWGYLLSLSTEVRTSFQAEITRLVDRVVESVYQFQNPSDYSLIINQLPDTMIRAVLEAIESNCQDRDRQRRNQSIRIKKGLLAQCEAGSVPKIKAILDQVDMDGYTKFSEVGTTP